MARSVRCWPGANAYCSRSSRRHVEGEGDGVGGEPLDVGDPQRVERGVGAPGADLLLGARRHRALERLEVVERLAAGAALPQGLARGRPEPGQLARVRGAARGHRTASASRDGPGQPRGPGGAMPYSCSARAAARR